MLVYLFSRGLTSFAALFYPAYASFKTLSRRPASEEELERWLMYWSVLGTIVGIEYWAEWLLSWVPLYYPFKMLFLIYLAMPQTRGATYVYLTHLEPFLRKYESQIDSSVASAKATILAFVQEKLRALWRQLSSSISQQDAQMQSVPQTSTANPPTQAHPATGTVQLLETLWRTYGGSVVATGAALIQQSAAAANAASQRAQAERASLSGSVFERRRQLEAELASLPPVTMAPSAQAVYSSSRVSSTSDINNSQMRERALSASKFEEIAVPEGYDDDDTIGASYAAKNRTGTAKRTSWFGWGSGSGSERMKDD